MLSHNLKLDSSMAKTANIGESKVLMCGLVTATLLFVFLPISVLSMVTLQPEMLDVPYMFSKVNHHLKQSGVAEEAEKCTEHELFNSWHNLAHMEDKLFAKVNSTRGRQVEVHEAEDHPDNHPGLLIVDAVGHTILTTSLDDFHGDLNREFQIQHKETGRTGPPSTSLGESPLAPSPEAASFNHTAKKPTTNTTSADVAKLIASLHIDYSSHPALKWAPHAKSKSRTFMKKCSEVPAQVTRKDVHGGKWAGRIPKVACIMAVPDTVRAHARLKYVVNNFRSQHYDGPKQLIIVYHYQDYKGAERIKNLADGHVVKAVAARTMEVPSSTALRYGAWAADRDTDLVARWDVDGWHHPKRLDMQVRALAFADRPACLLKQWTVTPGDGSRIVVNGELGGEQSLIGERAWMDSNWHPYLPTGEQALLAHKGQVALLDMAELLVVSPEHKELNRNSTVSK